MERNNTTNFHGIENVLTTELYGKAYGSSFASLFKAFTTNTGAAGLPHYIAPLTTLLNNSGVFNITSSGLNPFGVNTVFENIYSDAALQDDISVHVPQSTTVRTHGWKTPVQVVGWGYDIFGYPAPNSCEGWYTSAYNSGVVPGTEFISHTGSFNALHGSNVTPNNWLAGPVDMRWDQLRKIWTGNCGGVYAARVTNVYVDGDTYAAGSGYYAENVSYDVMRFDGIADQTKLIGVSHIGPKPATNTYKIIPLNVGDFCFIVHYLDDNDLPRYGVWLTELPAVEECATSGTESFYSNFDGVYVSDPSGGNPADSSGLLIGVELFNGLSNFPLPYQYGGLGSSSGIYPSGYSQINIFDATTLNFTSGNTSLNLTSGYITFNNVTFTVPTGLTGLNEVILPSSGILTTRNDLDTRLPTIPSAVNTTFQYPVGVTGTMRNWSYNSGILESSTAIVTTGNLYHGIPGTVASWPASNPAEPYFVWRKDDKELYHWNSDKGKWLGEKEFIVMATAAAMTSGDVVRQWGSVIPNSSIRGEGPPYDVTIERIVARWVTTQSSTDLSITQDGTIINTVKASGTYHDEIIDVDVSGGTVLGCNIGFSELSLGNPSIRLYYRRKG